MSLLMNLNTFIWSFHLVFRTLRSRYRMKAAVFHEAAWNKFGRTCTRRPRRNRSTQTLASPISKRLWLGSGTGFPWVVWYIFLFSLINLYYSLSFSVPLIYSPLNFDFCKACNVMCWWCVVRAILVPPFLFSDIWIMMGCSGGDLRLISMEGYGTDAYLHLARLSDTEEPLP